MLVFDLSALLKVIEVRKPCARHRSARVVILNAVARFCLATLLMEQETAVVCNVRRQFRNKRSDLRGHSRSTREQLFLHSGSKRRVWRN